MCAQQTSRDVRRCVGSDVIMRDNVMKASDLLSYLRLVVGKFEEAVRENRAFLLLVFTLAHGLCTLIRNEM